MFNYKNQKISFLLVICTVTLVMVGGCSQSTPINVSATHNLAGSVATPTILPTITITPETVNEISYADTGYEGYYTGIVLITEYYTLLSNGLPDEAYNLLSISEQNKNSIKGFTQLNEKLSNEIVTIQPLRVWQIEQGITPIVIDREDQISFFVQIKTGEGENKSNGDLQTIFLTLLLEDGSWKINSFTENFIAATPQPIAAPTLAPGSVPDRSYYDSIVVIAQFHVLFNQGLYQQAYQLLSPFRRNAKSLEEFISAIEEVGIVERRIVSIRPFYEGTWQSQVFTTPDSFSRRMFSAEIYAEGKGGWAGSVPNGIHGYYITTVLEKGEWKLYSVNTAGIP